MTALTVIPLLMSLLGTVMLWRQTVHGDADTYWTDMWAVLALAPLLFFIVAQVIGSVP